MLQPTVLSRDLLRSLFPAGAERDPARLWRDFVWDNCNDIGREEVVRAIRNARAKGGDPAPSLDGIALSVWKRAPRFITRLTEVYNTCLREGTFPVCWKRALLVLIPKGDMLAPNPSARPICLLSEGEKILERVIVDRLRAWMDVHPEVDLATRQFGFREGKSIYDAFHLATSIIRRAVESGGWANS